MSHWNDVVRADPELAAFAVGRFAQAVAYLGTIRRDGGPRVHPVSPIVRDDGLFLFVGSTSPKHGDLLRDPRFSLHAGVEDNDGGAGELMVNGRARRVRDPGQRRAVASSGTPDEHVLFELEVEHVLATTYGLHGREHRRWPARGSD